jgi:hypothetical protein
MKIKEGPKSKRKNVFFLFSGSLIYGGLFFRSAGRIAEETERVKFGGKITAEQFAALARFVGDNGFFSIKEDNGGITDAPQTTATAVKAGRRRKLPQPARKRRREAPADRNRRQPRRRPHRMGEKVIYQDDRAKFIDILRPRRGNPMIERFF